MRLLGGAPVVNASALETDMKHVPRTLDVRYVVIHKEWIDVGIGREIEDSDTVRAFRIDNALAGGPDKIGR